MKGKAEVGAGGAPLRNGQRERFALAVARGATFADAYREAYPRALRWKAGNVYKAASELAAVREVAGRIAALRAATAADGCATRHEVLVALSVAIRRALTDDALFSSAAGLVDKYCRMMGFYEPERVEARLGCLDPAERDAKVARLLRLDSRR